MAPSGRCRKADSELNPSNPTPPSTFPDFILDYPSSVLQIADATNSGYTYKVEPPSIYIEILLVFPLVMTVPGQ